MNRVTTCSFTGHRLIAQKHLKLLEKQLETVIISLIEKGFTDFCSGGALGFDQLAAKTVLRLKSSFPKVQLFLILPCKNQDKFWKPEEKETYRELLLRADKIIYTSEAYHKGCMLKRNRYLVDSASCILAYLTHPSGGTKYTVSYAEKSGVPVLYLQQKAPIQLSLFSNI